MNGWSLWNRLSTRLAVGSLALSLGLGSPASAQQLPQTLPPYNTRTVPGGPTSGGSAPAIPAIFQKDDVKETPKETPQETPKTDAPVVIGAPADCATCAPAQSNRHGGLFHPQFRTSGCSSGSCSSGGCSSCGTGGGGCASGTCSPRPTYGCGYGGCFPGHNNCCPIDEGCGPFHKFFACFYHCLCCPDPCYEPHYILEANSAFWVDGARPVTQTRIRWDSFHNFTQVDRSEFFWARTGGGGGKGPGATPNRLNANGLLLYQEAATAKASIFVEQAYWSQSPDNSPHTSGFGDMNIGTKALLFDCELLQVTMQFRTFVPIGSPGKGLGTGHVSLEPSLLATVKLLPETYLQTQVSEWIPIAGDPAFSGAVLHYHASINHVLYRCTPDIPFIGSIEANGYSFQDGLFSVPGGAPVASSGDSWWTFGPGIRMGICSKLDLGFSAVFGIGQGGPEQIYRSEIRLRF